MLPKAYLLTADGEDGGCVRYKFVPNPEFKPATYEERVGAALAGMVYRIVSAERS